jgi:hypothetical protein
MVSGNCRAGLAWSQYHLCVKAAAPKRVSGRREVMLRRAEDALLLSSRTFATKSALAYHACLSAIMESFGG